MRNLRYSSTGDTRLQARENSGKRRPARGNLLPAEGEAGYERALEKVKAVRELREDS